MGRRKLKGISGIGSSIGKHVMNTKEAAAYLSVSESFLEKDRVLEGKIQFCTIGKRGVRYRKEDLDRYLENNIKRSTSQPPQESD